MKFVARVKGDLHKTVHGLSDMEDGEPHLTYEFQTPKNLVISEQNDGFYLFRMDETDKIISDTWHDSLDAAMAQAEFEFRINKNDWCVAD